MIPMLQLLAIFFILGVAIAFLRQPIEMIQLTVKITREIVRLIFYRGRRAD